MSYSLKRRFINVGNINTGSWTQFSNIQTSSTDDITETDGSAWSVTTSQITVPFGGYYIVGFTAFMIGSNNIRMNPTADLYIGSSAQNVYSASNYMRLAGGHDEASTQYSGIHELSQNDTVHFRWAQIGYTGTVQIYSGQSSIFLHRIG
jgi:hypothetical protein